MSKIAQGVQQQFSDLITSNSATALNRPGTLRFEIDDTNGIKVYKYILAGTAIANGDVLSNSGTAGTAMKVSTVNSPGRIPATGIGIGTITSGYYGWVLVEGYHSAIKKPTDAIICALMVCVHLCGKAKVALLDAASTQMTFVDNIVGLANKVSACTTFAGVVKLM